MAATAGAGAGKHEEARVTERSHLSDGGRDTGKSQSKERVSAVDGRPIASAGSAAHAPSASASSGGKGSSAGASSGTKPPKDSSARPAAGKDTAAKAKSGAGKAATAIDDDIDALFSSMKSAKSAAVASVVDAEAKAAAKRKKQDAAERKAAAAIEELEAAGRKSNRIKGADSPVPVRCVRAGRSMVTRARSRRTRSGRPQASHDQHDVERLIATRNMFLLSLSCCRLDPETGMPIYTADQLKMGQGGDTADCPFDCDCCFG